MRAAGRKAWDENDYAVAVETFNRLWPLCEHKMEPGRCFICEESLSEETRSPKKSRREC